MLRENPRVRLTLAALRPQWSSGIGRGVKCCLVAGIALAASVCHADPSDEADLLVKAGLIAKFPQFIQWPEGALKKADGKFVICLSSGSKLAPSMRRLASFSRIKQRPTVVRELIDNESPAGCHLQFIDRERHLDVERLVAQAQHHPILTLADTPGFAQRGVMINLLDKNGRVRFEVNRSAAMVSHLELSFRLLEIAEIVDPATNTNNVAGNGMPNPNEMVQ